jgi:hypothetical protein
VEEERRRRRRRKTKSEERSLGFRESFFKEKNKRTNRWDPPPEKMYITLPRTF